MSEITVVGFGPGPWSKVTLEAAELLMQAERIYFRDPTWEVVDHLRAQGKRLFRLNHLYMLGLDYDGIYQTIVDILIRSARLYGPLVYAQPGNPYFFERTTAYLVDQATQAGLRTRVVEGMSCLETMFVEHRIDPVDGLQILNFFQVLRGVPLSPAIPAMIFQVGAPLGFPKFLGIMQLEAMLLRYYPPGHPLLLLRPETRGTGQERIPMRLGELTRHIDELHVYATLYVSARV